MLLARLKPAIIGQPVGSNKYSVVPAGAQESYLDAQLGAFITFDEDEIKGPVEACALVSQMIDTLSSGSSQTLTGSSSASTKPFRGSRDGTSSRLRLVVRRED